MKTIPCLLAVAALALSCGGSKSLAPDGGDALPRATVDGSDAAEVTHDVRPPDGRPCTLDPSLMCAAGGPSGSGAACQDFAMSPVCDDGTWRCPAGMIDTRTCTCGAPGANCANEQCTQTGWVCPDAGADATTDAGGCTFSTAYSFSEDGGHRGFSDLSMLEAPNSYLVIRSVPPAIDPLVCLHRVPCASASEVTVAAIEAAVANADVQAALAMPPGMLYGTDTRPVDGSVFVFQRDDGKSFFVGSGDAVPAGLSALATLLHTAYTQAIAACGF